MWKLVQLASLAAVVTLALAGQPSRAASPVYPWCSGAAAGSCGFTTEAQCWATVQGGLGQCRMNPFYEGPASQQTRARRR